MHRVHRLLLALALLISIVAFSPMGSIALAAVAATAPGLLTARAAVSAPTWVPRPRAAMPLLDRLFRRPSAALPPPASAFAARFDGVDDRITFGSTLATGTTASRVFAISFISDGTNLYETSRTVAMVA